MTAATSKSLKGVFGPNELASISNLFAARVGESAVDVPVLKRHRHSSNRPRLGCFQHGQDHGRRDFRLAAAALTRAGSTCAGTAAFMGILLVGPYMMAARPLAMLDIELHAASDSWTSEHRGRAAGPAENAFA